MGFYCPACEPDRWPSYGYRPAFCEEHGVKRPDVEAPETPQTQAERWCAYHDAIIAEDWDRALMIARRPVPHDATEEERQEWAARRDLARIVVHGA